MTENTKLEYQTINIKKKDGTVIIAPLSELNIDFVTTVFYPELVLEGLKQIYGNDCVDYKISPTLKIGE